WARSSVDPFFAAGRRASREKYLLAEDGPRERAREHERARDLAAELQAVAVAQGRTRPGLQALAVHERAVRRPLVGERPDAFVTAEVAVDLRHRREHEGDVAVERPADGDHVGEQAPGALGQEGHAAHVAAGLGEHLGVRDRLALHGPGEGPLAV